MHSVSSAARLCGVSPSTLRAWERRYGVVEPIRTEGGYRVYDDDALRRLTRMSSLIASGWSPRHAAAYVMSEDGDAALPLGMMAEEEPPAPVPPTKSEEKQHLEVVLQAAEELNAPRVSDELDFAWSIHSFDDLMDQWLGPILNAIREGGESGRLSLAGEHFLRAGIERRLTAVFEESEQSVHAAPSVLIGTPPGDHRVLTALGFATTLRRAGCKVTYLGAGLEPQTWLDAVDTSNPDVVVVVVPAAEDAAGASRLIAKLARTVPDLPVYAAGDGVKEITGDHATLLTGVITKCVERICSENAPAPQETASQETAAQETAAQETVAAAAPAAGTKVTV